MSTWAQAVVVLSAYWAYKALGSSPSTEENLTHEEIKYTLKQRAKRFPCGLWLEEGCASLTLFILILINPAGMSNLLTLWHDFFENLQKNYVFKVSLWFCVRLNSQLSSAAGCTCLQHVNSQLSSATGCTCLQHMKLQLSSAMGCTHLKHVNSQLSLATGCTRLQHEY